MELKKYAQFFPDVGTKLFFMHWLSIRHHNRPYDNENNTKYRPQPKIP